MSSKCSDKPSFFNVFTPNSSDTAVTFAAAVGLLDEVDCFLTLDFISLLRCGYGAVVEVVSLRELFF